MFSGKIALLGLGMQGKAALHDLVLNSRASHIIVADNNPKLNHYLKQYPTDRVSGRSIEMTDEVQIVSLFKEVDIVVESLPGVFALPIGKLAAKTGVHLVSSMYYMNPGEQDPGKIKSIRQDLEWVHKTAMANGAVILTEFGMDPGIDLVLGAQALSEMDTVEEFYSYGAGFPELIGADNPLKYKFTWSPIGVIRSYLRPGKIITKGRVREIDGDKMFSMENIHELELKELGGMLECYPNGNAVHYAELFKLRDSVTEMARYTCRWPGHCTFWRVMAQCGFLNEIPIPVNNQEVSPVQFVSTLLDSQESFHYNDQEQDITFIRIDVRGKIQGEKKRIIYQLIDKRDLETGFTSMQRTVGFTMSLGAQLILDGKLNKPGLISPIEVPYNLVVEGLKKHGMRIDRKERPWIK